MCRVTIAPHKYHVRQLFITAALSISIVLIGAKVAQANAEQSQKELHTRALIQQPPIPTGLIAFHSNQDGNNEIHTVTANGSQRTRITTNEANDAEPAFSPDSLRIAFTTDRDGNAEIYTMFADGTDLINLTNNAGGDIEATYSPDGTRIVFRSNRDGNFEIYSMLAADGSDLIRLSNTPTNEVDPAYSPDGTRIVFGSAESGSYEIHSILAADGSDLTQLTSNGAENVQPSYSPDGTHIVFRSNQDGDFDIYSMAVDGTNLTNLTNNSANDGLPAYSHDGTRIAFAGDQDGDYEIYSIAVDGSDLIQLTTNDAIDLFPAYAPVTLGTGQVQVTLSWANTADMDLEVTEPNGETISYQARQSSTGGELDVDSNANCPEGRVSGVENIFWPENGAPSGNYSVKVAQYSSCEGAYPNWTLTVRVGGQIVLQESGNSDMQYTFTN